MGIMHKNVYVAVGLLAVVAALSVPLAVGIVHAAPAHYDANGDGFIDRNEVLTAINDYLFSGTLSREEATEIITHYLFGDPVVQPEADARLSGLNLQNLELAPAFNPATDTYTATVPDPGAATTIVAVPANAAATVAITVEGAAAASGDTIELAEGAQVVELQVTSADGTATKTYTITITWAQPQPVPTTLSVSPSSVGEAAGATMVAVTVTLDGTKTFAEDKTVAVKVGKSDDSATSGIDYTTVADFDITIAAGALSGSGQFTLEPIDDALDEDDETITVQGSSASGLTVSDASISVTDDDALPALTVGDASVAEGSKAQFTVTLAPASARAVTVEWTTGDDASPGAVQATAGTDYTAVTTAQTVTIPSGDTSVVIEVQTAQDGIVEGDETFVVTLASPSNATLEVSKTAIGTITDLHLTSLSQEGFDCFFDRSLFYGLSRMAACSGWYADTIHKWENLAPDVWFSPDSKGRYITIAREVLAYLSPIVGMDFNYVTDVADAELIVFAGSSKAGDDSLLVDPVELLGCTDDDTLGCALSYKDRDKGVITGGTWVVWDDESRSDRAVKSTMLHEGLHAIADVKHSSNFKSIMRDTAFLDLAYMLPYEEDMYRLWAEPFVKPGMLASELRTQIANTPPDRAATDAEIAIDAFLNIVTHDKVSFDASLTYTGPPRSTCAHRNDSGTAVLFGGATWPLWNTEDFENEMGWDVAVFAGIDEVFIAIAEHGLAIDSGVLYEIRSFPAVGVTYSKVTIGYTTDIDDDGYLQDFTLDWRLTHVDPQNHFFCRLTVTGSNFQYSTGTVPASAESVLATPKWKEFGPLQADEEPS